MTNITIQITDTVSIYMDDFGDPSAAIGWVLATDEPDYIATDPITVAEAIAEAPGHREQIIAETMRTICDWRDRIAAYDPDKFADDAHLVVAHTDSVDALAAELAEVTA